MASNAPRVFREQTAFQNQKIGVARVYDGGQAGRALASSANRIAGVAFGIAASEAGEIAADAAKAMPLDQIMAINPETGEPQAISGMKGMGRIASRAYNRFIETRFKQSIGEELQNRARVLASSYGTDPEGYGAAYGDYINQMVGNAKGKWAEFIRETGAQHLARTQAVITANSIRAFNARAASSTASATSQGAYALQQLVAQEGMAAFTGTADGVGIDDPSLKAPSNGYDPVVMAAFSGAPGVPAETPRLSFSNAPQEKLTTTFDTNSTSLQYTVASLEPPAIPGEPAEVLPEAIPGTAFGIPSIDNEVAFDDGSAPAYIPTEAMLEMGLRLGGSLFQQLDAGIREARAAGVIDPNTFQGMNDEVKANIAIGLIRNYVSNIPASYPNLDLLRDDLAARLETHDWAAMDRFIPGFNQAFGASLASLKNAEFVRKITTPDSKVIFGVLDEERKLYEREQQYALSDYVMSLSDTSDMSAAASSFASVMFVTEDADLEKIPLLVKGTVDLWTMARDDTIRYLNQAGGLEAMNAMLKTREYYEELAKKSGNNIAHLTVALREMSQNEIQTLANSMRLRGSGARFVTQDAVVSRFVHAVDQLARINPDIYESVAERLDQLKSDEGLLNEEKRRVEQFRQMEMARATAQDYMNITEKQRAIADNYGGVQPPSPLQAYDMFKAGVDSLDALQDQDTRNSVATLLDFATRQELGLFLQGVNDPENLDIIGDFLKGSDAGAAELVLSKREIEALTYVRSEILDRYVDDSRSVMPTIIENAVEARKKSIELAAERRARREALNQIMSGTMDASNRDQRVQADKQLVEFYGQTVSPDTWFSYASRNGELAAAIAQNISGNVFITQSFVDAVSAITSGSNFTTNDRADFRNVLAWFNDFRIQQSGPLQAALGDDYPKMVALSDIQGFMQSEDFVARAPSLLATVADDKVMQEKWESFNIKSTLEEFMESVGTSALGFKISPAGWRVFRALSPTQQESAKNYAKVLMAQGLTIGQINRNVVKYLNTEFHQHNANVLRMESADATILPSLFTNMSLPEAWRPNGKEGREAEDFIYKSIADQVSKMTGASVSFGKYNTNAPPISRRNMPVPPAADIDLVLYEFGTSPENVIYVLYQRTENDTVVPFLLDGQQQQVHPRQDWWLMIQAANRNAVFVKQADDSARDDPGAW